MSGAVEVVTSPLLIRHVRGPGGAGGRRLRVLLTGDGALDLVVEAGDGRRWVTRFGTEIAVVHAYNTELRRAGRDGLASRPEATPLSLDGLRAAIAAAGGR